jgi:hypothetical protein
VILIALYLFWFAKSLASRHGRKNINLLRCEDYYENDGPFAGTDFSRLTRRMDTSFGVWHSKDVGRCHSTYTSMRKCISYLILVP